MRKIVRLLCFVMIALSICALIGSLGACVPIYKALGMSEAQATTQAAKDNKAIIAIVEQTRETYFPIVQTAIAGLATIIAGYLGVALKKEKGISASVITGVELAGDADTKQSIFLTSKAMGNSKAVAAKVSTITETGEAVAPPKRSTQG